MRVEHEVGTAAWLAGTLVVPSVQGHGLPPPQELRLYQSLVRASCSWGSEGLFGQLFFISPRIQALRGLPYSGSFSVVWCVRHTEGPPWLGSYSVDWRVRHLKGTLGGVLLCSSVHQMFDGPASLLFTPMLVCGEREAMVNVPDTTA